MKYLILNADDFGMSKVFNEVILNLIKDNKVTSTSVMVNDVTDEMNEQIDKLIKQNQEICYQIYRNILGTPNFQAIMGLYLRMVYFLDDFVVLIVG
jgi:hypothetical protein